MKVLIVEPGIAPREAEIDGGLKAMQDIVGGLIEAVYPYDDTVALVCNEEGKLLGLPLNRKLEDYDIIAGTFFICGLGEGDFASLPPDLMEKYKEKFARPEMFMRLAGISSPFRWNRQRNRKRPGKKRGHDER